MAASDPHTLKEDFIHTSYTVLHLSISQDVYSCEGFCNALSQSYESYVANRYEKSLQFSLKLTVLRNSYKLFTGLLWL